jgi:hypothetical protein
MTDLFDRFSILDPKREQDQIVAELGTNPFDRFSLLDVAYQHKQIEAAAAATIFTNFSHDAEFAEDQMEAVFGAGPFAHQVTAILQGSSGAGATAAQRAAARAALQATASASATAAELMGMVEKIVGTSGRTGV